MKLETGTITLVSRGASNQRMTVPGVGMVTSFILGTATTYFYGSKTVLPGKKCQSLSFFANGTDRPVLTHTVQTRDVYSSIVESV